MNFLNNSLQIILVLYKTKIDNSLCYQSLLKCICKLKIDFELLIYNNSSEIIIPQREDYEVINAPLNDRLAGAYNYALKQAVETKKKWLLLLDQDTELTKEYFEELNQILESDESENISVIIPQIQKGKCFIAPKTYFPQLGYTFFTKQLRQSGFCSKCISSINSGTVLNTRVIEEIGGFSYKYPLDGLDIWYFYQLYKKGKKVYVMKTVLEHDFSMLDYPKMTIGRYKSIFDADLQFTKELGCLAVFLWKLKIPLRAAKRLCHKEQRKYALLILSYLYK